MDITAELSVLDTCSWNCVDMYEGCPSNGDRLPVPNKLLNWN